MVLDVRREGADTGRRPARTVRPPDWLGYATAIWAAGYALPALVWTASGHGYPFGPNDPDNGTALLRNISPEVGAPVFAGMLLATAVAMLAMAGRHAVKLSGAPRTFLLAFGWTVAAVLVVVVPTVDLLALTGYAPMLLIGAPFGWPPVDYDQILTWSLANQALCLVGGMLVAATVLTWQRRGRNACASCGRGPAPALRRIPVATVARWATGVAVAIPLAYATTRLAWLAGIPLLVSDEFLRDLRESGGVWAGAGLGAFAVVGAILTLGLVQRWGEVFPRWMPGLRGRRVPIRLAVIPAAYVSAVVLSAGLGLLSGVGKFLDTGLSPWFVVPHALWPLWGLALGVATYAYYLRRRGRCAACERTG